MTPKEEKAVCSICGEPMPKGEEMFKIHGYSCACPKPPLKESDAKEELKEKIREMLHIPQNAELMSPDMDSRGWVERIADMIFADFIPKEEVVRAVGIINGLTVGEKYHIENKIDQERQRILKELGIN